MPKYRVYEYKTGFGCSVGIFDILMIISAALLIASKYMGFFPHLTPFFRTAFWTFVVAEVAVFVWNKIGNRRKK